MRPAPQDRFLIRLIWLTLAAALLILLWRRVDELPFASPGAITVQA